MKGHQTRSSFNSSVCKLWAIQPNMHRTNEINYPVIAKKKQKIEIWAEPNVRPPDAISPTGG